MSSKCLSELAESLQGFTKSKIKEMLKISAFYLEKQKSFIPKKYEVYHGTMDSSLFSQQMPYCPVYMALDKSTPFFQTF